MPVDDRHNEEMGGKPHEGRLNEGRPPASAGDDLFVWSDLARPARARVADAGPARPAGRFDEAVRRFSDDAKETMSSSGLDDERDYRPEPNPAPRGHGRRLRHRRAPAGAVLAAMLLGFFLAGLLDAKGIEAHVSGKPLGTARSVQLALLKPMTLLSGALRLDRPAEALGTALGRDTGEHHSLADVKPPPKPKWPRQITRDRPLRLYVVGDSMAQVFGSSLENLAENTHLVNAKLEYKVSSGLSRPDFYDWPRRLIDELVDYNPDATAVVFGANDGQDVMYQGTVLKVGTKAWRTVYRERVGAAMDILARGGRRVYWIGNPIMRDPGYRGRIAMMNGIYEAEARSHPGVTFVSTWSVMANKKGAYSDYLTPSGDPVLMRREDGIHLTRAGGDRMAGAVLRVIEQDWGMPVAL
jgi:uncharacterized protein